MRQGVKGQPLVRAVAAFIREWRFDFSWFAAMSLALWWLA